MGALRKLRRAGGSHNELEPLRPSQPPPFRKMSEVLIEFAQPILDAVDDDRYFKMVVQFAAICWDIAMYPESEQEALLNKFLCDAAVSDESVHLGLGRYARVLIARKEALFHNEKRSILDVKFVEEGEDTNVLVTSALPGD